MGSRRVVRNSLEWCSLRALIAVLAQTGFRKAEVSLAAGVRFGAMHLSLANLVWYIKAANPNSFIVAPTPEQLALLSIVGALRRFA